MSSVFEGTRFAGLKRQPKKETTIFGGVPEKTQPYCLSPTFHFWGAAQDWHPDAPVHAGGAWRIAPSRRAEDWGHVEDSRGTLRWVKTNGIPFWLGLVNSPPILEPILVLGLGCSLGVRDFDPCPCRGMHRQPVEIGGGGVGNKLNVSCLSL